MRAIETARFLAVGTELTTGATRDTNSGDLARELSSMGVRVLSMTALPDDLEIVTEAFRESIATSDMVVSTGGLGPTPDDLTREAIAAACGLEPRVDPDLEAWLREMFERRGAPMPEANLKQAWLVEGAAALPNARGSAPGWWLDRPDGKVVVALPGPPREWQPMWRDDAVPRLAGRLVRARASRTLRLSGIGESALVALIGEDVLRATTPQVATYARADAVDVVVRADSDDPQQALELVDAMVASLRGKIGQYIFAEDDHTWADALALALRGRSLAIVEVASGGQLAALVGSADFLAHAEYLRETPRSLHDLALEARQSHAADIGLAMSVRQTRDTHVHLAIATPDGVSEATRVAFLAGDEGRRRAAIAACSALWQQLSETAAAS